MDFALSDEHVELQAMLRSFFEKEAPTHLVAEWDRNEQFPTELYRKVAELGLCGITIAPEYGGSPADEISICVIAEEMARAAGCLVYAFIPTVTFCAKGIQGFGTEDQKREILPQVAAGTMRLAMGLSEPDAGSDLTGLATRAVRDGDDYVVTGQKIFTTGADTAQYIFCFVRTNPDAPNSQGMSVLLIPTDAPGVTIHPLRKLSGQGTHTCEVFLDEVRVPASAMVGEPGQGLSIIFQLLDGERIIVGAQGCGIGQGALDMALRHAAEREQFGRPIADFQAIGHMLADMALDIEMARLITYKAAWKKQNGLPCSMEASMAKIAGSEAGSRCATRGMQILGGYSYMVEYGMERLYRETKLNEIAGGSNQIQRNIVLKNLRRTLR
ncbi:MAG: acyl-CoA dehydrogenase family protein [Acidimicrobiia bacterium]